MQPTSHAAMSGGDCVKAGKRRLARAGAPISWGDYTEAAFRPKGLALTEAGAAGPNDKRRRQPQAVIACFARGIVTREGEDAPPLGFIRGAAS